MSFTKDDLKDGMVCILRSGGIGIYLHGYILCEQREQAGNVIPYAVEIWADDVTDPFNAYNDDDDDIMKITYGGMTVFEREEWRELTIDEAFEMLKEGPVTGEGRGLLTDNWLSMELKYLCPFSDKPYRTIGFVAHKFRIKK